MKFAYCANCQAQRGFKRSLGVGTIIIIIITWGIWLFALPFYPVRCIVCGSPPADKSSIPGYDADAAAARSTKIFFMLLGLIVFLAIASWIFER
jgi:hypothetical protein